MRGRWDFSRNKQTIILRYTVPILGCSFQVNFQLIVQTPIDNDPHTFSNTIMMCYVSYSAFCSIFYFTYLSVTCQVHLRNIQKKNYEMVYTGNFFKVVNLPSPHAGQVSTILADVLPLSPVMYTILSQ